jgi:hypothetical protein
LTINVQCDGCLKKFEAPDSAAGKTGKCSGCGAQLVVPDPSKALFQTMAPPADALVNSLAPDSRARAPEKPCPRCAEFIKVEALVCRFCGSELAEAEDDDDYDDDYDDYEDDEDDEDEDEDDRPRRRRKSSSSGRVGRRKSSSGRRKSSSGRRKSSSGRIRAPSRRGGVPGFMSCPSCGGRMQKKIPVWAIVCAILFCPLGLLFLLVKHNKCTRCGFST